MLKLIGNKIAVEFQEIEDTSKTKSGIIVVEKDKKDKQSTIEGVVRVVGNIDEDIKVGDVVIFGQYAGDVIEYDGKKLFILEDNQVLGVKESK